GHSKTHNLTVNSSTSSHGPFQGLEHHHGGAFAENHSFAVFGEWTAGVGGDDSHGLPGFKKSKTEGGFAASGNRGLYLAVADHPEGLADGMVSGGAGGGNSVGRTGDSKLHGDMAGAGIGHRPGNSERMDAVGVLAIKADV